MLRFSVAGPMDRADQAAEAGAAMVRVVPAADRVVAFGAAADHVGPVVAWAAADRAEAAVQAEAVDLAEAVDPAEVADRAEAVAHSATSLQKSS